MMTTEQITVPDFENWYDIAEEIPTRPDTGETGSWYLRYDPKERQVTLRTRHPSNNMTPEGEWHNRILTYSVVVEHGIVDARSVTDFLTSDEGQALLARISDGFNIKWNGRNHIGSLTDDAQKAHRRLRALLMRGEGYTFFFREGKEVKATDPVERKEIRVAAYPDSGFWDAAMWLENFSDEELGISADMTDDDVTELADLLYEEARSEGYIVRRLEKEILFRAEELRVDA